MARAMMGQSGMPTLFWKFAYASAYFIHNRIPNSWCMNSSPHKELYIQALAMEMVYLFGAKAIVHITAVQQKHKLSPGAIECRLLKPLMKGGWLLWEPSTNKMVQLVSVVFPQFQLPNEVSEPSPKGSLAHVMNAMSLGEVLKE
ncbi:hypothetical protein O181_030343 [Austropuccinia psidii MF-1]|uniref:Uncharacterized protein n=1 Tax=Austropuccinia psidii MF-1 TaxID=1389203 RepID=A0A9Q3H3L7_9BASI|nr:hypothetical protein [Austropuccinia psidii MF-1]